jgi:hypothetical protein
MFVYHPSSLGSSILQSAVREMGTNMSQYHTKNLFIGGSRHGSVRIKNLQRIADLYFGGNFSRMVNGTLDCVFGLDPATGKQKFPGHIHLLAKAAPGMPPKAKNTYRKTAENESQNE